MQAKSRYWSFRKKLHKKLHGHEPKFYSWRGISGTIYVSCHTCEQRKYMNEIRLRKSIDEKIR